MSALMHATVSVSMKHAVVRGGGVDAVVSRVKGDEGDAAVLAALLQLLANLMETAKAKVQLRGDERLHERLRVLAEREQKAHSSLARSAQCALHKYRSWQE